MICSKCKKDFSSVKAEKYITYEGIDEHHNPPTFMFNENEKWKGNLIPLCRNHHRKLHDEILEIMFKHSNLFKRKKSEHWTWKAIVGLEKKLECRNEVYYFTKRWLNEATD